MEKPSAKDYFLTVFIFAVCTLIGLLFQKLNFTDTNIVTIYILGVLLTSIVTDGYLCSVAGSFLSVFLFCFFLTEPRMSFQTYAVGYPVTFLIMLISSVLTGALAAKLKTHAKLVCSACFSYTEFCLIQTVCCKRQKERQRFLMLPVHSFFAY
ncbi:DUF4118 domain-containing protein [Blautia stercoris]